MKDRAKMEAKVRKHLDVIMGIEGGWNELLDIVMIRGMQRTLREARIAKGLTQVQVAERMDIAQNTLSEMETERYPDYRLSTLRRWSMALDIRTHWEISEIPTEEEADADE